MGRRNPAISVTLTKDLFQRVETYRYDNRIPSRSEAIAGLLEYALEMKERER